LLLLSYIYIINYSSYCYCKNLYSYSLLTYILSNTIRTQTVGNAIRKCYTFAIRFACRSAPRIVRVSYSIIQYQTWCSAMR